jgi:phosphoribosylanthranilate isomerase
MTVVKICGLTRYDDTLLAAQAGADLLGFIFAPVSKRHIDPAQAGTITRRLRETLGASTPLCVGVFVVENGTDAALINAQCEASRVDAAQLVGLSDLALPAGLDIPAYVCIRPATAEQAQREAELFERPDLPARLPTLQLDAFHPTLYGGTGATAAQEVIRQAAGQARRLMLAGGLTPDNVADAIRMARPWAVDVASGTEASPGQKDPGKVRDFIQAAKGS